MERRNPQLNRGSLENNVSSGDLAKTEMNDAKYTLLSIARGKIASRSLEGRFTSMARSLTLFLIKNEYYDTTNL